MQRDLRIRGYTVAQFPNPPLWVALGALLVRALAPTGAAEDAARGVFYVALAVWAWEEASDGVNGLRRALGVAGLAYVAWAIAAWGSDGF